MHYKILLFTEKLPSEEEIEEILEPYCEYKDGFIESSDIRWDWWEIGGRYCGQIEAEVSTIEIMPDGNVTICWKNINHKEIISMLFSEHRILDETRFYGYVMTPEKNLKVDGAFVKQIRNERAFDCWGFIDLSGEAHTRDHWDGENWIRDEEFDEKVMKAREEAWEGFMTVLDIHS